MTTKNENTPLGLSDEEQNNFNKNWDDELEFILKNPTLYGMTTLAGINVVKESEKDLKKFGDVKTIGDTRLISLETLDSPYSESAFDMAENNSIQTVLKCLGFGLDFGNSVNNILELDSIASYVPRKNFMILNSVNSAYDLQNITDDSIIDHVNKKFKLSNDDPKKIIRADYISATQGDSPNTAKFLLGDFNTDNVTLHYSVKKVNIPRTDGSHMFSIILSAVLTVKEPDKIYVVQVPFVNKHSN